MQVLVGVSLPMFNKSFLLCDVSPVISLPLTELFVGGVREEPRLVLATKEFCFVHEDRSICETKDFL
jgi:hypothetical protein